ncbi:T9SS type A sorting domain-containing protein [Chitinophagaceae bacterium MMS25-I14]
MKNQQHFFLAAAAASMLVCNVSNAQWATVGTAGFSTSGQSSWQHMAFDNHNTPYVSFNDVGLNGGQGTVMKFDGTSWTSLGNAGFTPGSANYGSIAIDSSGYVYFSFADGANNGQVAVMKYNGTSWSTIGTGLTSGAGTYTTIKTLNGAPYVAYVDVSNNNAVYVRKYNGSSWDTVGGAPVAASNGNYPSLTLDNNGVPYIAYEDLNIGGRARVQKFNGSTWDTVGASFLSEIYGAADDISIAFDHNNMPYVGYWNPYVGGPKAAVHKFDGTNWNLVGTQGFNSGISLYTSVAIGNDNQPYIAYADVTAPQQVNVMKYDGTSWVYIGGSGLSAGAGAFTSLAFDANGNPYVAYSDAASNQKTTVSKYTLCNAPDAATPVASANTICNGDTVQITNAALLHDAAKWYWYTGSCGGTLVDSGAAVHFTPNDTTTYYVRGYGGCVVYSTCVPVTVNVNTVAQPTISANGLVLTSSAATGNQWYLNGTAIPGATGQTYTATSNGNYTVQVTSGNCSSTSAATPISGVGIAEITEEDGVRLYPVPFKNSLQLSFNTAINNPAACSIKITDNIGRIVYSASSLKENNTLDLRTLSPGIYFVQLSTTQGSKILKVTKQ